MNAIDPAVLDFLEGLARFKVIFIKLVPNEKHSIGGWERYINAHERRGESRLDYAVGWLKRGFGVAFLPQNRLWAVDLDRSKTGPGVPMRQRLETFQVETQRFGPRVQTPSGGEHVYFRLPDDLDMRLLKNHVCHPMDADGIPQEWDFKMGPRTLLVAPGTLRARPDGSVGGYRPATQWIEPAICDPRWIEPGLPILKPELEPFTVSLRGFKDRNARAVNFLKWRARPSVRHSGGAGHRALWSVAVHLVVYLQLEPGLAVHLMTHADQGHKCWNDRCVDIDGRPAPWSKHELYAACWDSMDDAPPFGVKEYQELQAKRRVQARLNDFADLLKFLPSSDERMYSGDLYRLFLELMDLDEEECTLDRFGKTVGKAIRQGVIVSACQMHHSRTRGYEGVSESMILQALQKREELRTYLERAA